LKNVSSIRSESEMEDMKESSEHTQGQTIQHADQSVGRIPGLLLLDIDFSSLTWSEYLTVLCLTSVIYLEVLLKL